MSPKIISVFHGFAQADPSCCYKKFHTGSWYGGQFSKSTVFTQESIFFFFILQFNQGLKKKLLKPNLINNQGWMRCTKGL